MSKETQNNAPVSAEPVGLMLEIRTLGNYGAAYDPPGKHRAYTYDHQPGNVKASRLGNACLQAAAASGGDTIDHGLGLLRELQAQGFGVFDAESSRWHTAPVAAQPDVTQQTLDDVMAGIPARDAEIEALRKEIEALQAAQAQQPVSGADGLLVQDEPWSGWACQYPGKLPRLYGAKEIAIANHHPEEGDRLLFLTTQPQPSGNAGELDERELFSKACFYKSESPAVGLMCGQDAAWWGWQARAELAQQDADKVDAALAEMVHAMFRSGNSVPVTRITIDRKQYEATIDAARKEQA